MSDRKIDEKKIINSADLYVYLCEKAYNHSNYKYYAKREYVEDIVRNHNVYLSRGTNWNDVMDRDTFNTNISDTVNFGLCLSYSRSENVAMWMLYSGNDGRMIDFKKDTIKDILATNTITLGYFSSDFIDQECMDSDFTIQIVDIIYYDASKKYAGKYYVKRSDEKDNNFDMGTVNHLQLCKKSLAWSYENECRIIVRIPRDKVSDECTHIKIQFDSKHIETLMKEKRIYDSPNTKRRVYFDSALKDKINWNLCRDCSIMCKYASCLERK